MNNNKNLRYIMYARKSSESEDRQASSINDQIKVLKELASREGLNVVKILSESKSAKIPHKREAFNELMENMYSEKADAILCWKLNRLSRNSLEGGIVSHSLETNVLKEIMTPGKSYFPDDNVLTMAVELGMSTQYSKDLSKDTKRGLLEKVNRG